METNCDKIAEEYVDRIVEQYNEGKLDKCLDDCQDVEFTVNRSKKLVKAKILLTSGKPDVWINANFGRVEVSWGGAKGQYGIPVVCLGEIWMWCINEWKSA